VIWASAPNAMTGPMSEHVIDLPPMRRLGQIVRAARATPRTGHVRNHGVATERVAVGCQRVSGGIPATVPAEQPAPGAEASQPGADARAHAGRAGAGRSPARRPRAGREAPLMGRDVRGPRRPAGRVRLLLIWGDGALPKALTLP
jgi:hypothetical protein